MPFWDERTGKWRGRVYKPGGRAETKSFTRKQDAKSSETDRRRHWEAWRIRTRTGSWSLHEAASRYLTWVQARHHPGTYADRKKALKELMTVFDPKTKLEHLEHQAQAILEDVMLQDGRGPALANKRRKDLSAFFSYARRIFGLRHNPIEDLDPLPVDGRRDQVVPTRAEFLKLLAAAGRQDRNLLTVWAGTGPRKSEILRVTWQDDVDLEGNRIRYGTRKTRSGNWRYRWVPFGAEVRAALLDQWEIHLQESDYVFQNRDERSRRYQDRYTARRRWMPGLCKTAKVKRPIRSHGLRRYYASLLVAEGTDLETVRDLLGHGDVATTARYIYRLTEDTRDKAAHRIRVVGTRHSMGRRGGASRGKPGRGQVVRLDFANRSPNRSHEG